MITEYDFSAPPRLAREHARLLELAFETFTRTWSTQLSSRLPSTAIVAVTGVEQNTYDNYVASLPSPCALVVFSALGGSGVFQLSAPLALDHLDHALGGPGGEQPERALTDIEISVTLGMVERALGGLSYALASIATLEVSVEAMKQDPQFLQAGRANDVVVVIRFDVQLGERHHEATMMLPLAPLQAQIELSTAPDSVLSADEIREAAAAAAVMSSSLPGVPLEVSVRLAPVPSSPEQVVSLGVGDLLRLGHRTDRPLDVVVSGTVIGTAMATSAGQRRAALIISTEERLP